MTRVWILDSVEKDVSARVFILGKCIVLCRFLSGVFFYFLFCNFYVKVYFLCIKGLFSGDVICHYFTATSQPSA